jgi:hypothetical protein
MYYILVSIWVHLLYWFSFFIHFMFAIGFPVFVMPFNKLIKMNWISDRSVIDITICWLRKWIAVFEWIHAYVLEILRFVIMLVMIINIIILNYYINIDRYQYYSPLINWAPLLFTTKNLWEYWTRGIDPPLQLWISPW